jgi:hypothetical protein
VDMNNSFSTTSNLLSGTFESEQLHLPQRYNKPSHLTIQKLSSELVNGSLNDGSGSSSACDLPVVPSSVYSPSMDTSNVVEHSAYSFENPDVSLMEFDDGSNASEKTATALQTKVSSAVLDCSRRISKQANEKIESDEFMAFQKWLEERVDVIAD